MDQEGKARTGRLEVRWPPMDDEMVEDTFPLDCARGLQPTDLTALAPDFPAGVEMRVEPSGVGVGASSAAVALVVEVERFGTDAATLVTLGTALWVAINKIRQRRRRGPIIEDDVTRAALGAAERPNRLAGTTWTGSVPIVGSHAAGTDERHIWGEVFVDETMGRVEIVFMSPSGLCLGTASIPIEIYWNGSEWITRSAEEISRWSQQN